MKRFFRTAVGKAVLFIICVLSVIILGLSVVGIALSLDNADIMYLGTEETFCDELFIRELKYDGYRQVSQAVKMVSEGSGDMEILPDSGNALFAVRDEQGNKVIVSEGFFFAREWKYPLVYAVYAADDKEHDRDDLPFEVVYLGDNGYAEGYGPDEPYAKYTVWYSFKDGFPEADRYALIARYAPLAYRMRYAVFAIAFLSLLTAILSFVALMSVAGRRPDTEEIVTGPFSFIPYEIFVAAAVGIVIVMILAVEGSNGVLEGVIGCASAVIALCLFIGLSMCAASRIKQKTFFQNTLTAKALMLISGCLGAAWGLTKKVFDYFRQGLRNMSVTWKTVLVYLGFSFAELIAVGAADETDARVVMFILERALILPAVVIIAVIFKKLYAGGQALARGDLAHYTDTKGMFWDLKRHGEDLNSIASGMAIAVEDRLKSERMKAELITNVSHDIKTPLTSIINYASLIGEEEGTSEKTKEYTEVLVRQSERLKRLLEDLVEASKASTGNLDVDLMQCDAGVFLDQASGEYSEKLAEADLTLVTKSPEKEVRILADGRRMWRIFDNLMNNICKYSMPGTRVYLSLEEEDGKAVFTFKNTSKDELNISEEELMERFTRGDSSRNTEGNGLGLSIARSMAELQNGALDLSIDGDLFKAILTFPVIG